MRMVSFNEIVIKGEKFFYKTYSTHSEWEDSHHTRFFKWYSVIYWSEIFGWEWIDKIFPPKITYGEGFYLYHIDIEDPDFSKEEIKLKILTQYTTYLRTKIRKQQIENGEII